MRFSGFRGRWNAEETPALQALAQTAAGPGAASATISGAHASAPHVAASEGLLVALAGAPVWPGAERDSNPPRNPAETLLAAYRRLGLKVFDGLHGAFAVAIADEAAGRLVLAVDRMGIERMIYALTPQGVVYGSSAETVARFPWVRAPLRQQALFDYLLLHMVPAPATVYEGVHKLRPGTYACYENERLIVQRYWQPAFIERHGAPEKQLAGELERSLQLAVKACAPDARTGAFLSGGLDSSTVAGMLGRVAGGSPRTFSIGFGVDAYDELQYARIANRRFGGQPHEYNVTADDIVTAFPKIAAAYDEPFGNSSAVPTYFCALLAAKHGVTHLLAGDGGDELFGGNERYARQQVFEAYSHIPASLRSGVLEPLMSGVSSERGFLPLRKLRSYIDQANIPLPDRLESWNFMYRTDLGAMLAPEFAAAIDTQAPLVTMREVYHEAPGETLLNKMLFYDWHFTLSDNDLRKVGAMCELAGVRVSYPMLDPRVIDVSIRVPSNVKMRGRELRSFYKRALKDFLPPEIIAKSKHGFGLPFGVWLKSHAPLREMIYSLLTNLKARHIVRPEFLDDLIAQHRDGHASYYGYAIWDLAMLESWLTAHPQR